MSAQPEQADLLKQLLLERYEPIAIVGIGLRFPGGNDTPAALAEFLRAGRAGTGPIPSDRWDVDRFAAGEAGEKGKIGTAGGGFLDRVDQFDPKFFNISPKEAQYIDPQQRLVLETAWEALENANIDPTALRHGNGGVYVGASCVDYTIEMDALDYDELEAPIGTGTAHSAIAGRLSHFLGVRGPSIAVDTACSSSIVALHLAVEGLRRKECDVALCGGVNAIHHPRNHIVFSQAHMLAPDGRCKTFDEAADGYSRSEGCGMIVLKRLSDAKRAGDRVLALVRGTAVRHDGESGGLTVPNGFAQEAVMRAALASAMLEPRDVQYVEAHGTGTSLGDPIEMRAISSVFAESHTKAAPVTVGSFKTNVGHMEAAAGIGGVVKTVLQLHNAEIYPHLHFETPSSHIAWDRYPVAVPTQPRAWSAPTRRALVNSFGFAGTIATAVLEQAPATKTIATAIADGGKHVFTLSAKSEKALRAQIENYERHLAQSSDAVGDLCITSNAGRAHFGVRLAGVVESRADIAALLQEDPRASVDVRKVAFLFTGQGAQHAGMGAALYRRYPLFRQHVDECDALFAQHLGRSIKTMMFEDDGALLQQTQYTQPALFALEYATARLWQSWGVTPNVLLGHSIGEVVAACVAGLFSLEDAVRLVSARARLMQSVSAPGGMLSVRAAKDDVAPLLAGYADLSFAAVNAPQSCVVSGGRASLAAVAEALTARGIATKELAVSHAFHSPLMTEVFDAFRAEIAGIRFREPELTLVSNLTGEVADPAELSTPEYWVRHIGEPVNFLAGMRAVEQRGTHAFLEMGPDATLLRLGKQCIDAKQHLWLESMQPADADETTILKAIAALYTAGLPFSWAGYHQGSERRKVTLPTYAFERKRYWLASNKKRHAKGSAVDASAAVHPLLGAETSTAEQRQAGIREFTAAISPDRPAYLRDHVVMDQVVFPGAGYIEILLAAQDAVYGETRRALEDIAIHEPLMLTEDEPAEVRTRVRLLPEGAAVDIVSVVAGTTGAIERRHVSAVIGAACDTIDMDLATGLQAQAASGDATAPRNADDLYADFADRGLKYGPEFQRIVNVTRRGASLAVSELRGQDTGAAEHLPPAVLDCVMQSLAATVGADSDTYLPVRFGSFQLLRKPKGETLHAIVRTETAEGKLLMDALLLDGDRPVFLLRQLECRRVANTAARRLFHETRWIGSSLGRQSARADRHLLLVNARPLASDDARLTFAADAAEAVVMLKDRPTDVCWFWRAEAGPMNEARLRRECEANYRDLLELLRGLESERFGRDQRLWLVTEAAQWLPGDAAASELSPAATLWGFGHSVLNEYPSYRATLLDLPAGGGDALLLDEVLSAEGEEFQIAYRAGRRYVRRIRPSDLGEARDGNFELTIKEYGQFGNVKLTPCEDVAPQGDEIQLRVHATGLNFKDVLNALGLLKQYAEEAGIPYRPLPLGFECSGTVIAAGPEAEFGVGDEVIVSSLGSMQQKLTVSSAVAARKPANISFAEAAGIPAAYITAYYALHHLAGIKAGDRVLIHAAAGGVGQAAVQLAKLAGATVFATASPSKWPLLRAQGVEHISNSRSLDFADDFLRMTGGQGVDIVLNSLNKDFIPAGLRALGANGRFVELGKLGIWSAEQMRAARPDVRYHNFDLSEFAPEELTRINQEILRDVAEKLAAGDLQPLPTTSYSLDEVEEAFGILSRGQNSGKLVFAFVDDTAPRPRDVEIRPDRTYLITGGLGALGIVTAEKLVQQGARHLALVSRRAVAAEAVAELEARLGACVTVYQGDVASSADVQRIAAALRASECPVGGIVHAAGVLADRPISAMTWEDIDAAFQPKVYATWLLHEAAVSFPELQFFAGYSSIASMLGSAAQANYAGGNAFIDALMTWRAARQLPALSINWGPWAEVGMAAGLSQAHIRAIESQGIRFLKPVDGTRALLKLLGRPVAQASVGEFDWDRYVADRPVANALYKLVARKGDGAARKIDLDALASQPMVERRGIINELIRAKVAALLHFDGADDVAPSHKFSELGMDSLVAVELKNGLESAFRVPLPTSLAFDYPSIDRLTEFIDSQIARERTETADPAAPRDVRELSEDDIDAELAALRLE